MIKLATIKQMKKSRMRERRHKDNWICFICSGIKYTHQCVWQEQARDICEDCEIDKDLWRIEK